MKKLTRFVSAFLTSTVFLFTLAFFASSLFSEPVQLAEAPPLKSYQFQMNGRWLPAVNPLHVGANNYTDLKNLRPTDSSHETVEGFTKINTTAVDPPINVHHFSKTGESHVIAKVFDTPNYYLYDNTGTIPNQNNFQTTALKQVASGTGSFANGPQGTMFYADGTHNLVWGGNEIEPLGVYYSSETDATDLSNVTQKVTNGVTTESFIFGEGGNDSKTVLLLQADDQADAATTITDSSTGGAGSPHTVTANGDAQIDTAYKKFSVGAILFDGTGDYLSIPDNDDFALPYPDLWFKINSISSSSTQGLYNQYDDVSNFIAMNIVDSGSGTQRIDYILKDSSGGGYDVTLSTAYHNLADGQWHHVTWASFSTETYLYLDGIQEDSDSSGVTTANYSGTVEIGRSYNGSGYDYFNGSIDEFRISEISRHSGSNFTPQTFAYNDSNNDYLYITSPYKLNGIKIYVAEANITASTLTGAVWVGDTFSSMTLTDNTSAGGKTIAQTGTVTFAYNDDAKIKYIDGVTLFLYRFHLNAGGGSIYKISCSAPLQPIRDVWNGSQRTCISFQFYDSPLYEDYTFQVSEKDSTDDAIYAADIGGMSQTNDHLILTFDDRTMGVKIDMLSSKINASAIMISDVQYYNGTSYVSVGYFEDGTLDSSGTESFGKSGVIWWNPPPKDNEHAREQFGVTGYSYKIVLTGAVAVTANTSIDRVTGITAPLEISGYDRVGVYSGRVMLIDGNRVDYSQTDTPWIFNGVDSSDDGRLSLYFGDDNPITQTGSIYNRYGSNLVEAWVATKNNSTYTLTGNQPDPQYSNPFVIKEVSQNIGCAAPMSFDSAIMEVGEGLRMGVAVWMDFSGPVAFNGAEPIMIDGIENFFDPAESSHINYSYISKAVSYIDTIHNEWNLLFPVGASTANSKWVVYSFKYKKWYEKVPTAYPVAATATIDSNGARYNYGFLSTGYMMRLDNSASWDSTAIAQSIKTGYFSPPVESDTIGDSFGFWTRSEIRAVRLLSAKIAEDRDVTVKIYNDGSLSANSPVIALDASGIISKNTVASGNLAEHADFYQIEFSASTSSNKWEPLAWGYKARKIRTD